MDPYRNVLDERNGCSRFPGPGNIDEFILEAYSLTADTERPIAGIAKMSRKMRPTRNIARSTSRPQSTWSISVTGRAPVAGRSGLVPENPPRLRPPRAPLRVHQLLRGPRPAAQAGDVQALGSRGRRCAGRAPVARRQASARAALVDAAERRRELVTRLITVLTLNLLTATVTAAQSPPAADTSSWKSFRDPTLGFEVKHPPTSGVRRTQGTLESVRLGEPLKVGK